MLNSGVALAYVGWRTLLGRIRRALRSPLRIALAVVGVGIVAALQFLALRGPGDMAFGATGRDAAVAGVLAILAIVSISATLQCPVLVRGADISWLFPCPGGPRALVLRHVVGTTWMTVFAAAGAVAGGIAANDLRAAVVQVPFAVAGVALAVRGTSTGVYLLRVQLINRWIVRVVVPLVFVAAAIPAAARAFGFLDVIPATVIGATGWLRAGVGALVDGILSAGLADWATLTVSLSCSLVLCALCVVAARGFADDAARASWEAEAMRAMLSDPGGSKAVVDLASKQLTKGVPSFERLNGLRGDAAFTWKSIASARRSWRSELRGYLPVVVVAVPLALWAPRFAPIPAALLVIIGLMSSRFDGVPAELDRTFIHTIPGTPWRRLLAVDAAPALRGVVGVVLAWLPVLVLSGLPPVTRYGGLLAFLLAAVLVPLVSSLAAVAVNGNGMRILVTLGVMAVIAALVAAATAGANLAAGFAVAVAGAAICVWCTARLLPRRTG